MTPAQQWSAEFRRAMTRRGMSRTSLVSQLQAGDGTVDNWWFGRSLPSLELGVSAAEVLGWKRLKTLLVELRTRTCERATCRVQFITKKAADARFCSARCRQYRYDKKRSIAKSRRHQKKVGSLLSVYKDATYRLCTEWCPGGSEDSICPDASCPIQEMGLSPLPVTNGRLARVA